jgi:tetratricopeptide (TPR) repeat protein
MRRRLLPALCCALCLSCSTAPQTADTVVESKNQAAEFTKAGNDYFNKGLYDKALDSFYLSLAYNISVDNERGMASSYNSIGSVDMAKGNYDDAMKSFDRAYGLAQKLRDPVLLAQTATKIGEVYLNTNQLEKARDRFLEAVKNQNGGIPEQDLAILFHDMGSVLKRLGKPDDALGYITQALAINERLKRYEEMATNYYMIASIYSEKNMFDQAMQNAMLALENDKKVENTLGIAKDYLALGLISRKRGNDKDAYAYLKKTYEIYNALTLLYPTLSIDLEIKSVLTHLVATGTALGLTDEVARYKKTLDSYEKRSNP